MVTTYVNFNSDTLIYSVGFETPSRIYTVLITYDMQEAWGMTYLINSILGL